jgi:hypothetical protein
MAVQTQILHRRDTAANWTSTNPTLGSAEIGVETDTNKFKIGNGSSSWTALSYQGGSATFQMWRKAASGGETSLSGSDDFSTTLAYTVGAEQVFINGVLLERGVDYTASTGTSITGLTALVASDVATVVSTSTLAIANAIPLSTVTAKGDYIVATGASTVTNLAVGADGTTLVADSSTSTGLRYQPARTQQLFLNSAYDVWQRGTTGAGYVSSGGFVADRWQGIRGAAAAGMTMSRQAAQNTALPNVQYSMRMQRDSGNTGTQDIRIFYSAETADSIPFAGQTITFSYYVRKGANYSGGDVIGTIYSGTGTDQNLGISGYTGSTAVVAVTRTVGTLTTDWTRVQGTATVAATATELGLLLYYTPTGTAGANDWIEITGMQLEVGSIATPFKRNSGTLQGELAACQRYYYRATAGANYESYAVGVGSSTTNVAALFPLKQTMRSAPTAVDYGGSIESNSPGVGAVAITAVTLGDSGFNQITINCTSAAGITATRPFFVRSAGNTTSYIGFSAEL